MADTEHDGMAETGQRPFPVQAATFSLLAPLLVLIVGVVNVTGGIQMPAARIWLGVVNLGLLVCGFGLGIAALACRGKHPARGVVSRAVIGIVVNGLLLAIVSMMFVSVARTARHAKARREQEAKQAEDEAKDAFTGYPGWLGVYDDGGTRVVLASLDRRSPLARDMNAGLRANITPISLSIVNRSAPAAVTVDPSSVRLVLADGTEQPALPSKEILATAREDPEGAIRAIAGPYRVRPGASFPRGLVFIPYAFDMTRVSKIVLRIDDREVVIEGHYYTAEERAALYRKGLAAQRGEAPTTTTPQEPAEQEP